jgi:hypothetical protein
MTTTRQFSLALDALVELKQDVAAPPLRSQPAPFDQTQGRPAAPTLDSVFAEIGSLPREALFLGVASDGLPLLLNLHDPVPGPLLIIGDAGAGKTAFLQTLAQGVQRMHPAENIQFGVITSHPAEWENIEATSHRVGIFPVTHNSAQDFIRSLASWAHANHKASQSILLLIDDLESVARLEPDTLQNLRWLLLRGPARRVWPVITLDAERYGQVLSWIPMFRTRIFGRIAKDPVGSALGSDAASALDRLAAGIQFSLRENGKWLKFWLPSR